ncbi:MAG: hypothetical protein V4635_10950 [Bacteroidota bacterium]
MKFNYSKFLPDERTFKKPGVLVIIFAVLFAFWYVDLWRPYNAARGGNNFVWDVFGYYSYLPATFCNQGSYEFENGMSDHNPTGPLKTHLPKYTYGMSAMYAPFFALGYKIAYNSKESLDGFSEPFATCIKWGSIFYILLGLFFLRKFLLFYFNEMVVAIVLFVSLFGSVLFMYTYVQSEMTHGYLFFLFSVFLYLTHLWHLRQKFKYTLLIGVVIGMISLIRPTEVFIFLFFIFWNVRRLEDLRPKLNLFLKNYLHLLLIFVISVLIWVPQLMFYKTHTGSYFYFPYENEGFFWSDPQIMNILFSYRKGWITYTPLVVLAFAGFFFVKKDFPVSKWTFFLVTALIVYVLSCWWDWGYGGCFGAREFCQHIVYLAIPMAALVDFVFYSPKKFPLKGLLSLTVIVFLISCVCLNIGQTYQYQIMGRIHYAGMSEEIYWNVFRTYQYDDEFNNNYSKMVKEPDFSRLREGKDRDR